MTDRRREGAVRRGGPRRLAAASRPATPPGAAPERTTVMRGPGDLDTTRPEPCAPVSPGPRGSDQTMIARSPLADAPTTIHGRMPGASTATRTAHPAARTVPMPDRAAATGRTPTARPAVTARRPGQDNRPARPGTARSYGEPYGPSPRRLWRSAGVRPAAYGQPTATATGLRPAGATASRRSRRVRPRRSSRATDTRVRTTRAAPAPEQTRRSRATAASTGSTDRRVDPDQAIMRA